MNLSSEMALHIYRQVFLGVDRPLGYTLELRDGVGSQSIEIPDGIGDWYVRHHDDQLPDWFVDKLVAEVAEKRIPGLSLASCRKITNAGFGTLAKLGNQLEVLDLFNTNIDDAGLEQLLVLGNLRSLNLAGTLVTNAGVATLTRLPRLEHLHLGWADINDQALQHLATMRTLRTLVLRSTKVSNVGMAYLARMTWLETLDLQETQVGDEGVKQLLPLGPTLVRLYLGYTGLTDTSREHLKDFSKLRTLMLRATLLDRRHDEELRVALVNLGGVGTGPGGAQEGLIR